MKVVFLDRDGVINKKQPEGNYVTEVRLFEFNPGIFDTLGYLKKDGFRFIVITNQRGIAKGRMTEVDLERIHSYMRSELEKHGIEILDIFHCPHEENSCDCRKPKPGMLVAAMKKYDINLVKSILISDSAKEVEMGEKFGVGKNILVKHDEPEQALDFLNVY